MHTTPPLTRRDAWAGTFEHLLGSADATPRTDCPLHLPDAPEPALNAGDEGLLPINDLQHDIAAVHAHVGGAVQAAAAHATFVASAAQKDVSAWLQSQYNAHSASTAAWQQSKRQAASRAAPLTVMSRPPSMSGCVATFAITYEDGVPVQTINAAKSKSQGGHSNGSYCLEWQNTTSHVGYSDCYPTEAPGTNRDKEQHWIVHKDATIRPAEHSGFCLTNDREAPGGAWLTFTVSVAVCDGRVEQHWATAASKGGMRDHIGSISFATEVSLGLV